MRPIVPLSMEPILNNLPLQLSSFVGRERETAMVRRLLAGSRLVTLTGPGGVGKTRLAIQAAAEICQDAPSEQLYADGVWLVELAPLADPALVPQTAATVLDVSEQPGRPLAQTLSDGLRTRRLLLVLDNCEHVILACAQLAEILLRTCPGVRILATSREALGIAGETIYQVPSLGLPAIAGAGAHVARASTGQTHGLKKPSSMPVQDYEAVRLFMERATAAQPGFALTDQNASAVAQICVRLDGIPLAIELAAAYVRSLSAAQIVARLDDRFHLLTGGSRTALPRQQTLQATIDWSYNLLTGSERILFRRLSVFAGGWTLEAAEEVCQDAGQDGILPNDGQDAILSRDVLDLLSHLVDKSLVVAEQKGAEVRYRMLETIRQFAREKLLELGEGDAVRDRHLHFFADFAGEARLKLISAEQERWLERSEAEHDNLRAAIAWSSQGPDLALRLRLPAAMLLFWQIHGYHSEGLAVLRQALAHTTNEPWSEQVALARVDALFTAIALLWAQAKLIDARPYAEEMLNLGEHLGHNPFLGRTYFALGLVAFTEGDYAVARDWLLKGIVALQGPDDTDWLSASLFHLGDEAYFRSDYSEAQRWYTECVALTRQRGDKNQLAYPLRRLGYIAIQHGELNKAEAFIGESLTNNMDIHEMGGVISCLAGLAAISLARAHPVRAVTLCGCVDALLEATHKNLFPIDKKDYEHSLASARAQLGEPEFAAAWEVGRALTLEQAIGQTDRALAGTPEANTATLPQTANPAGLTAREVEVLRLLAQGLTDVQIAETLVISPRTVNAHLRSIYGKLDVTTRTGAVRVAREHKVA